MRLQVFSDLHLEFGPLVLPKSDADVIIAAGDIDLNHEAIAWLESLKKPVIYVAGNHEYWGSDIDDLNTQLREKCANSNVHFLQNNVTEIDGVHFLGTTLWTNFNDQDQEVIDTAWDRMNDFSFIGYRGNNLTPHDLVELNTESVAWIDEQLQMLQGEKCVVVTHHAPSFQSWTEERDETIKYAYCNDLSDVLNRYDIELWVHGHVHDAFDYEVSNTRVLCNPRGYYGHHVVDEFVVEKVVEI